MNLKQMKAHVLKVTPAPKKVVKPSKKAQELEAVLVKFERFTPHIREVVRIITGIKAPTGQITSDGHAFNVTPLACVVPLTDDGGYEAGKPYLYAKGLMLRHADGSKSGDATSIRYATRKEIDAFFKRVDEKGCEDSLATKF